MASGFSGGKSNVASTKTGSSSSVGGGSSSGYFGKYGNSGATKAEQSYQDPNALMASALAAAGQIGNAPTNQGTTSGTTNSQQTQQESFSKTANTTGQSVTNTVQRETGTVVTDKMDPATRKAYEELLKQLQAGGSATQQQALAALASTMQGAQARLGEFTTAAAKDQAQRSNAQYMATLREGILPQLNAAMESAGLSGDVVNALLSQDAASRTARQAADAEANLITQYGQLAQGQQGVVSQIGGQLAADPVQQALLTALGIGKDSMTTEVRNLLTQGQSVQNMSSTTQESGVSNSIANLIGNTTGATSEQNKLGVLQALAGLQGSATEAARTGMSQSAYNASQYVDPLDQMLKLQQLMPGGMNLLGGMTVANSPTHGVTMAAPTAGGAAAQVAKYAIPNISSLLGRM